MARRRDVLAAAAAVAGSVGWAPARAAGAAGGPAGGAAELVGQLERERSFAEGGAGLLKAWAKEPAVVLKGQRLYLEAKAASDEAIGRLLAALTEEAGPEADGALRAKLEAAAEKRLAFSRHVDASLDALEGKKSVIADALGRAAGEIVKGVIAAAVEVWKTRGTRDDARRETLWEQIRFQRWKPFGEVPAA